MPATAILAVRPDARTCQLLESIDVRVASIADGIDELVKELGKAKSDHRKSQLLAALHNLYVARKNLATARGHIAKAGEAR
jgi:hypothetical protein